MESVIKQISEQAKLRGYDVRIRDIAYALLKARLKDELIAYTVVFGTPGKDNDVTDYESLESTKYLVRWFEQDLAPKEIEKKANADIIKDLIKNKKADDSDSGSMTFEENRAGIEKQIEEVLELKKQLIDETGKCTDVKTMSMLQKTEMDARSRLNDKFGASEKSAEQYIIVQKKFDFICPHTRRECYQMDKKDAMKKWNLIEK